MAESDELVAIRKKAMDLLARREHSAQELRQKLKTRDYEQELIDAAVLGLQQDRLQCDHRFAETYVPVSYTHLTLPTIYSV